jgi:hypothetical protein
VVVSDSYAEVLNTSATHPSCSLLVHSVNMASVYLVNTDRMGCGKCVYASEHLFRFFNFALCEVLLSSETKHFSWATNGSCSCAAGSGDDGSGVHKLCTLDGNERSFTTWGEGSWDGLNRKLWFPDLV